MVCQVFHTLGIPVFNADMAARYVMEHDPVLVQAIANLIGNEVYVSGKLDRARVASIVFKDKALLDQLNSLVHPVTIEFSQRWLNKQSAPYCIKEAAIFFESGSYREMDVMIGVFAPQELRIGRAMHRSGQTREQVLSIIGKQMDEGEKMKRCDFVITNDDQTAVLPQVLAIHEALLLRNG